MNKIFVDKFIPTDFYCDLFLACCSQESRCTYALNKINISSGASYFIDCENKSKGFEKNRKYFYNKKFKSISSKLQLHGELLNVINELRNQKSVLNIGIDITCFTREIMAQIISIFCKTKNIGFEIHFFYSLGAFSPPPESIGLIEYRGPVTSYFSGWASDPSLPTTLILGLGYEPDLALGFIEQLEPQNTYAFRPTGHDLKYTKAIDIKNKALLLPKPKAAIIEYDISNLIDMYVKLENLVYEKLPDSRIIIAPFGLKSLALVSFLVAVQHYSKVSVWSVRPEPSQSLTDRKPSGKLVGIKVTFNK